MEITVIGAGYVGLVTGVNFALSGHRVTFVEAREDRREALRSGRVPIEEPGLPAAFASARKQIRIVDDMADAGVGDLVLVAVGTPIGEEGRSDLRALHSVLDVLRQHPSADVCIRSTLPPGYSLRVPELLGRGDGRRISTNPEFLRQGEALFDVQNPSRIVFGVYPDTSAAHIDRLHALYEGVKAPRLTVSVTAAELIKNVSNAFLALKLSFVNEVASLSEEYDVDVEEVLNGISLDPRIGNSYMRPGVGFGGSCLPKELEVVANAGRRKGLPMHVARAVMLVNVEQQSRFARRIVVALGPGDHKVALLGLSFKAHTDDLRGSPSIAVARELIDSGITVVAHDPVVKASAASLAAPGISIAADPVSAANGADAVVIGTDWPAYAELDWAAIRSAVAGPLLFDGRNLLDRSKIASLGFTYSGVGRQSIAETTQVA